MQISPLLAGGLLLALLSVRLEAKPASQLPQKVWLELPPGSPSSPRPAEGPNGAGGRHGVTSGGQSQYKAGSSFLVGFLSARGPLASPDCPKRACPGDVSPKPGAGGGRSVPRAPMGSGLGRVAVCSLASPRDAPFVLGSGEGEQSQSRCTVGRVRSQSPPGSPAQTGVPGASPGEGAPQIGVPRGARCPGMLRRRSNAPEATDTGWHCPGGQAQRWGHGLRGAPGQRWERSGGVPVSNWGAGCRERGDTGWVRVMNGGEQPQVLVGSSPGQGQRWGTLGDWGGEAVRKECAPRNPRSELEEWRGTQRALTKCVCVCGAVGKGFPNLHSAAGDTLQGRGAGRGAQSSVTPHTTPPGAGLGGRNRPHHPRNLKGPESWQGTQ